MPESGKSRAELLDEVTRLRRRVAELESRATARRRRGDQRESEDKYRALVGAAEDAIFVADLDTGVLLEASIGAERLVGMPVSELVGMHQSELHPPEEAERYRRIFAEHSRSGGKLDTDLYVKHRDGQLIPVEIAASVFELGGRKVLLAIFRDITERRRAAEELARQNAELVEANEQLERLHRAKDEFIAIISHELRTPLVTGLGYIELLLEGLLGPVSEEAVEKMRVAQRNLKSLASLIDQVFDYHVLVREDLQERTALAAIDLSTLLDECVEDFLVRSGRDRDAVTLDAEAGLPPAWADADMIRRAVANLLDNADRHGGPGVRVTVSACRLSPETLEVSVSDDGPGIEAEILDAAFEPFVRASARRGERGDRGGQGLGLSIVRAILAAHESDVRLDSKPGRGTTVTFDLSVPPASPEG